MTEVDRGARHFCPECKSKYYDMKQAVESCPICGAKQPKKAPPQSGTQLPKRRPAFARYP